MESVRESREMSYISGQSRKSLFHKIQIFDCAYSALLPFYSFFTCRFKNHLCIEWYIRKGLKNRKRLVASRYSLRKIQIFKFAYSALPLCYSLFRLKSSLHRVVYMKRVKESEEISCITLQSFKRSFHKIQNFKFAYSALLLFYSLFRLSNRGIGLL